MEVYNTRLSQLSKPQQPDNVSLYSAPRSVVSGTTSIGPSAVQAQNFNPNGTESPYPHQSNLIQVKTPGTGANSTVLGTKQAGTPAWASMSGSYDSDTGTQTSQCQETRTCNTCRQKGHIAPNCPNRFKPKCIRCKRTGHYQSQCNTVLCYNCGDVGHYSAGCTKPFAPGARF